MENYNKRLLKIHLRTILLLLISLVLLRAWFIFKNNFSFSKLTLDKSRTRKLLWFTILFSLFTVVEATPTNKQAVNIIQTAWLTYIAYRTTLNNYTPTTPWSVRRHINIATLNLRGGFDLFTKRSYITHKCLENDMDFLAIIDSNHKNPHQIKWDTSHWPDTDSGESPWSEIDTNYTFHATTPPPDPPTSGRGIILLAHHRWSRRKTRTKLGSNERWIA